jgi:hypothetical protein
VPLFGCEVPLELGALNLDEVENAKREDLLRYWVRESNRRYGTLAHRRENLDYCSKTARKKSEWMLLLSQSPVLMT